jgi:MerR family transcriptional regulator, light-induced transcriptional regulator
MGLLFVYYLLRKHGLPVIYLGSNVPLKDVSYLFQVKTPQYLYLHLTAFPRQMSFQKYLTQISQQAPECNIIISGVMANGQKRPDLPNIRFVQTLPEVVSFISSIRR